MACSRRDAEGGSDGGMPWRALTASISLRRRAAAATGPPSAVSVPLQFDYDNGRGPKDRELYTLNLQPVVRFRSPPDWLLISRAVFPLVSQNKLISGGGAQCGSGDTVQSFFFSPKSDGSSGLAWGVGPALLLPTASED